MSSALLVATVGCALPGCASTLSGYAVPAESPVATRRVPTELAVLLPRPTEFPDRYPAVVLPAGPAARAAADLEGVGSGSTVRPAECAPPRSRRGADTLAVAVGSDEAARTTVTVELARTDRPLADLRDRVRRCGRMRVSRAGAVGTVTTELEAAPPVAADDVLALRREVRPEADGAGLGRSMLTRVAQVGDVRVGVTLMWSGENARGSVDSGIMSDMFALAVRRVRQG